MAKGKEILWCDYHESSAPWGIRACYQGMRIDDQRNCELQVKTLVSDNPLKGQFTETLVTGVVSLVIVGVLVWLFGSAISDLFGFL